MRAVFLFVGQGVQLSAPAVLQHVQGKPLPTPGPTASDGGPSSLHGSTSAGAVLCTACLGGRADEISRGWLL